MGKENRRDALMDESMEEIECALVITNFGNY